MRKLSMLAAVALLCGCATFSKDDTLAQQVYAVHATYVSVLEEAVDVAAAPDTPENVSNAIIDAVTVTAPVMQMGEAWANQWVRAKADYDAAVKAGLPPPTKLAIVTRELNIWMQTAPQLIQKLVEATKQVGS